MPPSRPFWAPVKANESPRLWYPCYVPRSSGAFALLCTLLVLNVGRWSGPSPVLEVLVGLVLAFVGGVGVGGVGACFFGGTGMAFAPVASGVGRGPRGSTEALLLVGRLICRSGVTWVAASVFGGGAGVAGGSLPLPLIGRGPCLCVAVGVWWVRCLSCCRLQLVP